MDIPKKVFVSYKYSDVVEGRENTFNYRDELIKKLGDDGLRHKGEDEESFDMEDFSDDEIYQKIAPYIKKSSITVVLITPNAKHSKWIPWEISLSLRERVYKEEQNMTRNGLIGVYLPLDKNLNPVENGTDYSYYINKKSCGTTTHFTDKFPKMIQDNTFNLKNGDHKCDNGCCDKVYDSSTGSYMQLIKWEDFISDMKIYIDKAWKRRNNFNNYECRVNLKNGK
jgi:hypothetical protein